MPSAIEYARGIVMMVMKAGMASDMSSMFSFLTSLNIIVPRTIRGAAVAASGIARNAGEKNMAMANPTAIVKAVSPERPPCDTPVELSTYVQEDDVPRMLEQMVPMESA